VVQTATYSHLGSGKNSQKKKF